MHVICVDDEQPALDNFRFTVASFDDIETLHLFQDSRSALEWAKEHPVDTAFLDIEMPVIHGMTLARCLRELDENIHIVFVTAYAQYALEAFGVSAIGYVLKPYSREDIRRELDKAALIRPKPRSHIVIRTIPNFSVYVEDRMLHIGREKVVELFALLVDHGERGITSGEGISYLWPNRPGDANTQALFRVTYKRLVDALDQEGIANIIETKGNRRFVRVDLVDCDLYRILSGDAQAAKQYTGEYLREYAWAEARNAQLYQMLLS